MKPHLCDRHRAATAKPLRSFYDRYFERIHDFVRRTLRNEADAADVTQEVFIKAMASISTLSNPGVFKSWLFTVARNLSISRIRGARQVLSLDYAETDEPEATLSELVPDTDIAGAPEEAAERAELAAMVWAVAAGLDARQYTVLDLSVRQELDAAEMAEVLGVTRNNAYVMVNRTKAAFSESAGDYFIYRDGVQNCPGLREELARANIKAFSPEARKAIERHVKHCPRCGEKKKRLPLPLAMFSGLALAAPPEGLRERIRTSLVEWPGGLPPDAGGAGTANPGDDDVNTRALPGPGQRRRLDGNAGRRPGRVPIPHGRRLAVCRCRDEPGRDPGAGFHPNPGAHAGRHRDKHLHAVADGYRDGHPQPNGDSHVQPDLNPQPNGHPEPDRHRDARPAAILGAHPAMLGLPQRQPPGDGDRA
ncbi:MAG: sigma-70 family RNA polymerase sigma factor [Dehalococcoidia bacterium]|uniref:RNA polymerase sigma factor n=1 Tax=Candidatus Amarobacter glycogenicus TaxID=3140699 RepID=UPI003136D597|nr:sigma-70 family RNA polymerase sigma factor [Dehalococcoidia bacterium]